MSFEFVIFFSQLFLHALDRAIWLLVIRIVYQRKERAAENGLKITKIH